MRSVWFTLIVAALATCCCHARSVWAQSEKGVKAKTAAKNVEVESRVAKFMVSLSPADAAVGEVVTLSIDASVKPGWHIGATATNSDAPGFPTQIRFVPVGLEVVDETFVASVAPRQLELGVGTQLFMEGEFSWARKYRVTANDAQYGGTGDIRFQACDDKQCLPPQSVKFDLGEASTSQPNSGPERSMTKETEAATIPAEKAVGAPMVLSLVPCELTRTRPQLGNILSLLLVGRTIEKMVWKATIPSGPGLGINIYLPRARQYSLHNTGSDGTVVSNTATFVSIDQNADGQLADWEAVAVDRPIRVHDTMYRVTDIDAKNQTLTLQQLDMPLKGSLIGFRCPDFEYTALDGSIISNQSILGKTTVLDIWAVTCHNCYEGFPKLQRALDKHSTDKLRVILLTVDTDRQFYDSQAPRLFQTYGGGDWPQVMIPGGFDGALTIGNYGFGSVIVDEAGIVRAVGVLGFNIEATIDEVLK